MSENLESNNEQQVKGKSRSSQILKILLIILVSLVVICGCCGLLFTGSIIGWVQDEDSSFSEIFGGYELVVQQTVWETPFDYDGVTWEFTSVEKLGNQLSPIRSFGTNCNAKKNHEFVKVNVTITNENNNEYSNYEDFEIIFLNNEYDVTTKATSCVDYDAYSLQGVEGNSVYKASFVYEVPTGMDIFELRLGNEDLLDNSYMNVSFNLL